MDYFGFGTLFGTCSADSQNIGNEHFEIPINFFMVSFLPHEQDFWLRQEPKESRCLYVRLCDIMLTSTLEEFLRVLKGLK